MQISFVKIGVRHRLCLVVFVKRERVVFSVELDGVVLRVPDEKDGDVGIRGVGFAS